MMRNDQRVNVFICPSFSINMLELFGNDDIEPHNVFNQLHIQIKEKDFPRSNRKLELYGLLYPDIKSLQKSKPITMTMPESKYTSRVLLELDLPNDAVENLSIVKPGSSDNSELKNLYIIKNDYSLLLTDIHSLYFDDTIMIHQSTRDIEKCDNYFKIKNPFVAEQAVFDFYLMYCLAQEKSSKEMVDKFDENEEGMPNLSILPYEIISKIIFYISAGHLSQNDIDSFLGRIETSIKKVQNQPQRELLQLVGRLVNKENNPHSQGNEDIVPEEIIEIRKIVTQDNGNKMKMIFNYVDNVLKRYDDSVSSFLAKNSFGIWKSPATLKPHVEELLRAIKCSSKLTLENLLVTIAGEKSNVYLSLKSS